MILIARLSLLLLLLRACKAGGSLQLAPQAAEKVRMASAILASTQEWYEIDIDDF